MCNLTSDIMNEPNLLWQLTGARPGPILLATGILDDLAPVVERLQLLPSLVYLRGSLMVGPPNTQVEADEVLALQGKDEGELFQRILTRASELGMISGRGLPAEMLVA